MEPSGLRQRGVIYLTVLMTFTVRALSAFLTVWFMTAAAFPLCCWSMAYAHEHQRTTDIASSDATSPEHRHDRHERDDSDAAGGTASVLSSIPAYDCDTGLTDAATTMGVVTRAAMRPAAESAAGCAAPRVSAHKVARSDTAPPGTTFNSAFLNPLRI